MWGRNTFPMPNVPILDPPPPADFAERLRWSRRLAAAGYRVLDEHDEYAARSRTDPAPAGPS